MRPLTLDFDRKVAAASLPAMTRRRLTICTGGALVIEVIEGACRPWKAAATGCDVAVRDPSFREGPRSRRTARRSACRRARHVAGPAKPCCLRNQGSAWLRARQAWRNGSTAPACSTQKDGAKKSFFTSAIRPPRARPRRADGDHHLSHAEFSRQQTAEHRPGAAERHQGEVARIDAKAADELVDLDEHVRRRRPERWPARFASQIHSQFRRQVAATAASALARSMATAL